MNEDADSEPTRSAREQGRRRSLARRLALFACVLVLAAVTLSLQLARWLESLWLAGALASAILLPVVALLVSSAAAPFFSMFRALAGTVTSYRDGDFAFSLAWKHRDELGDLVSAHNALGDTLRDQRLALVQRELLLDTMVQHTPVAMLLCGKKGRIVYANLAARKLLGGGRRMEGLAFAEVLDGGSEAMREAVTRGGDGLFVVESGDEEEIYHLARRAFRLNGQPHELFVLRHLTAELRRQEVQTWKKVIRIISHELNNSLAPIASLAHSGAELVRRGQLEQLERVFDTIGERARHLDGFVRGYARFAKLPLPQPEEIEWDNFLGALRAQVSFEIAGPIPVHPARFDRGQLEQAMLNLLLNAHESGSAAQDVTLCVRERHHGIAIEVLDRGPGMNETVLSSALLPFYSTKREGTGLGLALVREIAEAHGGRVSLTNREAGGLQVSVVLPQ